MRNIMLTKLGGLWGIRRRSLSDGILRCDPELILSALTEPSHAVLGPAAPLILVGDCPAEVTHCPVLNDVVIDGAVTVIFRRLPAQRGGITCDLADRWRTRLARFFERVFGRDDASGSAGLSHTSLVFGTDAEFVLVSLHEVLDFDLTAADWLAVDLWTGKSDSVLSFILQQTCMRSQKLILSNL